MQGFDLMAILKNPEFSRMLIEGVWMTLVIAGCSWVLGMALAFVLLALRMVPNPLAERFVGRMSHITATCRRWCS